MLNSKVTLTAALKDELSAPLTKVERNVEKTAKTVEDANKRQGESSKSASEIIEKATARATGAQSDMEKALERATGKRADALHSFEQASKSVTIAEQRLESARSRADGNSTSVLTAEKNLEAARYKQEKALQAVATATGNLEEAQADLLSQNEALAAQEPVAPKVRERATQGEALQTLAPAAAIAGGAMTLGFGKMLNTYADFDKAMSQVKAFTQESDANMALLRDAAMKYGADTAYSAEEAAGAINELGKAGVSTKQILSGGLEGALSLAAAGELDVSKAAEIASGAMTQFKLSGDQIPHLADLLAAGAGKAMGSVEDLGMALGQSGLVASATGLNIEETTGTLAAFASANLMGSDAGTSLKTMLQRLSNPSKEAAREMEKLGINMYDANGEFAGMDVLAGQLSKSLGDKTSAERDAAMATIFGSDAVRAANVLYEQGAEGIQEWTDKVNDSGYAAKTAADLQNNLAGDLEKLGGSFDTVFLQSGSGANDVLRLMVQGAEDLVDWIGELPSWLLQANAAFILVGGAALLSGAAIPKVMEMRNAIFDLIAPTDSLSRRAHAVEKGFVAAGLAVAAITIAKTGIEAINDAVRAGRPDVEEYFNLIKTGGSEAVVGAMKLGDTDGWSGSLFPESASKSLKDQFGVVTLEAANAKRAIEALGTMDSLGGLTGWFQKNLSMGDVRKATEDALQLQEAMKGIGKAIDLGESQQGIDALKDMATQLELNDNEVASLINKTPELKSALVGLATGEGLQIDPNDELGLVDLAMGRIALSAPVAGDALDALSSGATALSEAAGPTAEELAAMEEELAEVGLTLEGVVSDMEKYLEFLFATGLAVMSSRDAQVNYQDALRAVGDTVDELIEKNGSLAGVLNQNKTDFDLTTEAGAKANSAFQDLARGGMDQVKAMANEGVGQDVLQQKLTGTYNDLIKAADAFGITGQAGIDLTRHILGIPDGVKIDSWMSSEAKRIAEETTGVVNELDGKTAHVWVTTHKNSIYSETHTAPTYSNSDGTVSTARGRGGQTANSGGGVYLSLPAAAGGAIVDGYAPGVDSELMLVSPGEAVLVPELVRAIGPSNVMALNHLYSGGRPAGGGPARATIGSLVTSFAPGKDLAKAAGGAVVSGGLSGGLESLIPEKARTDVEPLIRDNTSAGIEPVIVESAPMVVESLAPDRAPVSAMSSFTNVVPTSFETLVPDTMPVGIDPLIADRIPANLQSVIPDSVPTAWVEEFTPSTSVSQEPAPTLSASPAPTREGATITLQEGAVQVNVPAGAGADPEEIGRIVQAAVTAALEAEREKMEQAY